VSPAAFVIDGIQNGRTTPDWMFAHEKRQERDQWEQERSRSAEEEQTLRQQYDEERAASLRAYLASDEGREKYEQSYEVLLALYKVTEPHRFQQAAREAALSRLERLDFRFPEYAVWAGSRKPAAGKSTAL
jgi:hypothetical protein